MTRAKKTKKATFDELLQAAIRMREAQRAYMADRGNEELGRMVGQRAVELDKAIHGACFWGVE